ncbi:MAG: 50S ribosomal protein L32 [Blastocatellia bacterium]|jgi:large subunit ribosomal protein L32|nr:50S ribosomal protein L32 [Blastocatellia bacterium]MBN8724830.1 50S ribosomal protein L32 [Acidobacteriota bacterium]
MPNPKRRHSKARRGKRRAHDGITAPLLMACPHCKAPKETHRVCSKCGYYGETQVFETEE